MTERYWAKPNWIRWLNVPSVRLDVAASLSLGFEPQSIQKITQDENGGKTVKWFHPAYTTNEGSDRLSRLRDFFNTEHLPAYEVPALPGHRPEERIRLLDLVRFAIAQDWEIPPKLAQLVQVEPQPTPEAIAATGAALPKQRAQEFRILELLREKGYDPLNLPSRILGLSGPKAEIKPLALLETRLFSTKTFDTAWQRLRDDDRIRGG